MPCMLLLLRPYKLSNYIPYFDFHFDPIFWYFHIDLYLFLKVGFIKIKQTRVELVINRDTSH